MSLEVVSQNDRISQTAQKIENFRQLPVGWHFGSGVPPTGDTIQKAIALNRVAAQVGFTKTNAFPGVDGEIQITLYDDSVYLEFTIESDGTITFVYEHDNKEILYKEKLSLDEAVRKIQELRGATWVSSELFIDSITTPIKGGSQVLPLSHLVTGAGFPLSMKSVSYRSVPAFVSTSPPITEAYLELCRSSGTYTQKSYPDIVSLSSEQVLGMFATTIS